MESLQELQEETPAIPPHTGPAIMVLFGPWLDGDAIKSYSVLFAELPPCHVLAHSVADRNTVAFPVEHVVRMKEPPTNNQWHAAEVVEALYRAVVSPHSCYHDNGPPIANAAQSGRISAHEFYAILIRYGASRKVLNVFERYCIARMIREGCDTATCMCKTTTREQRPVKVLWRDCPKRSAVREFSYLNTRLPQGRRILADDEDDGESEIFDIDDLILDAERDGPWDVYGVKLYLRLAESYAQQDYDGDGCYGNGGPRIMHRIDRDRQITLHEFHAMLLRYGASHRVLGDFKRHCLLRMGILEPCYRPTCMCMLRNYLTIAAAVIAAVVVAATYALAR